MFGYPGETLALVDVVHILHEIIENDSIHLITKEKERNFAIEWSVFETRALSHAALGLGLGLGLGLVLGLGSGSGLGLHLQSQKFY